MSDNNLIQYLNTLYQNLYWSFNHEAKQIPCLIDNKLWEEVNYNPILFLDKIGKDKLNTRIKEKEIHDLIIETYNKYQDYLNSTSTWLLQKHKDKKEHLVAYFSAEYGFHESFPIYSGGLGILSGDHLCSASDLGLNFIGVGLLYKQGYVEQKIDHQGIQQAEYPFHELNNFPVKEVKDDNGDNLIISVSIKDKEVYFQVWEVCIGRIRLYLLDTDIDKNNETDRALTAQLYGGGREMRISQEIILGMGGVKALKKMNFVPSVWHLNEGHSAFILLELAHDLIKTENCSLEKALQEIKKKVVFTTHTPVKAGNESFTLDLMRDYFQKYCDDINISMDNLLNLGAFKQHKADEFSMTILALQNASFSNGVSQLHGEVSQKMWQDLWPEKEQSDIPIDYITNGVNMKAWVPLYLDQLFQEYIDQDWYNKMDNKQIWQKLDTVPDERLWQVHLALKQDFINYIKINISTYYKRNKIDQKMIDKIIDSLNQDHLMIGFARRFAPYKRATLFLQDEERIKEILNNQEHPVHMIFAGKAHPADDAGKALIKKIYEYSLKEEFMGKIILLENYNIHVARYMTSGADMWLNNPRRPYEASGTSGQKAAANGVINFSVLDGWWVEGYNKENGWIIGKEEEYTDTEKQDQEDSLSFYDTLENEVLKLYYDRDNGIPHNWITRMKASIASNLPVYNTIRMVKEYCEKFYFPLM